MKPLVHVIVVASCLIFVAVLCRCGGGSQQSVPPLTITTASLPNGTAETLYSQTIQASGGVAPFTWTVPAGALPHGLSLSTGATNTVTISGKPDTVVQAVAFTIKVTDSARQSATQSYTVSILPEPDTLTISPGSLNLAPQLVGTASGAQTETLTNTGTSVLNITSIAIIGANAAEFKQSASTCGATLASAAECTIDVTFMPSQLGPRSASIMITDDTGGSPQSVSLSGIGVTSGPNATLSATSFSFGSQVINTTTPPQSVTLSNYGSKTLNITGITATANFGETDDCSASLIAEASCTINVTFTPSTTGSVSGTLFVADNAPSSPQKVTLSGIGGSGGCIFGNCFGNCNVDPSSNTLTGYCSATVSLHCQTAHQPTQCPPGQLAKQPQRVQCGRFDQPYVDLATRCNPW